jgi:ABC-type antimicrobial peptide transport system permease subunit
LAGNSLGGDWLASQKPPVRLPGSLFALSPALSVIGVGIALAVGVLGGLLPSRRAVALQPLHALRYE